MLLVHTSFFYDSKKNWPGLHQPRAPCTSKLYAAEVIISLHPLGQGLLKVFISDCNSVDGAISDPLLQLGHLVSTIDVLKNILEKHCLQQPCSHSLKTKGRSIKPLQITHTHTFHTKHCKNFSFIMPTFPKNENSVDSI